MWFAYQFMIYLHILSLNIPNFLKRLYGPLLSVICCQVDYFVCRVCVQRRVAKIGTDKNGNTTNFVIKFQINITQKDVHRAYICWWIYLLLTHYDQKPVELWMYYAEAILNHIRIVWNCFSFDLKNCQNNFRFATLTKYVTNKTNCRIALKTLKKVWICLVFV